MANHGIEPVQGWWKPRTFAALVVPAWIRELLNNSQPFLLEIEQNIRALTVKLKRPRRLGNREDLVR